MSILSYVSVIFIGTHVKKLKIYLLTKIIGNQIARVTRAGTRNDHFGLAQVRYVTTVDGHLSPPNVEMF